MLQLALSFLPVLLPLQVEGIPNAAGFFQNPVRYISVRAIRLPLQVAVLLAPCSNLKHSL